MHDHKVPFQLGQVVMTPGAEGLLKKHKTDPIIYLTLHQNGDFGTNGHFHKTNLGEEEAKYGSFATDDDAKLNKFGVLNQERVHSCYELGNLRERLWIITDPGHEVTTLLLPDEY